MTDEKPIKEYIKHCKICTRWFNELHFHSGNDVEREYVSKRFHDDAILTLKHFNKLAEDLDIERKVHSELIESILKALNISTVHFEEVLGIKIG